MTDVRERHIDRRTLLRAGLFAGAAGLASSCSTFAAPGSVAPTTTAPPVLPGSDPFINRWSQFNVPCVWNRSIDSIAADPVATARWRAAMGTGALSGQFASAPGDPAKGIPLDRFEEGTRDDRLFASESQLADGTHSAWMPKPRTWEISNQDRHWSATDGRRLWEAVSMYAPEIAYQPGSAPEVDPSDPFYFLRKWYHYQTHRPVSWDLDVPTRSPHVGVTDSAADPGDVWTKPSAMASGLPIMPLLADAAHLEDPAVAPELGFGHALLITVPRNMISSERPAWPATYTDGDAETTDSVLMGWRVRMSASVNPDDFPPQAAVVIRTLQRYGAYVSMSALPAQPGEGLFRASLVAAPSRNAGTDATWDLYDVRELGRITCNDFEVMDEDVFQSDPASFAA